MKDFEKSLRTEKRKPVKSQPKTGKRPKKPRKESEARKKIDKVRKEKLKLADKFKSKILEKYKDLVKTIVIFGSVSRGDVSEKSDIDLLVVVDDTKARFTPELKMQFDKKIRQIGKKVSQRITVQPAWTLTEFWDMARIGHPLLYTIVRDGWALYDTGFFIPIRKLLEMGKIPTTLEAVEKFMSGAPKKLKRVKSEKLYLVAEDLYYAMLNASQAVLMYLGINPPAPKYTSRAIKEHLVDQDLLEESYLNDLDEVIEFRKGVEHKEIKDNPGEKLDEYIKKSEKFIDRMEQLLTKLEKERKYNMINKNYQIMVKATVSALKNLDKLPPEPKNLPKAIKQNLIKEQGLNPNYERILKEVIQMKKMADNKRANEIPEKDIQLVREYVRRYIYDLGPLIKKDVKKELETKTKKKGGKKRKKENKDKG